MRYTLFGHAEGVLAQSVKTFWAVVRGGRVLDASMSARNQGIRVGMSERTAEALLPHLVFFPPSQDSDTVMPRVWRIVESYTPWVEFVDSQRFYAQIPVTDDTSKEVRELVLSLQKVFSPEQRVRLGLAECKAAARALVEWSRHGTVPGAGLFVAGEQQLLVSPAILEPVHCSGDTEYSGNKSCSSWLRELPLAAMWTLPASVREQLAALGVFTFGQFLDTPDEELKAWFGKEIWLLKQQLFRPDEIIPAVSDSVPSECTESWSASVGEAAAISNLYSLAQILLDRVLKDLWKYGLMTQHIQLEWETDKEKNSFSRTLRQPLCTEAALWNQLLPGFRQTKGHRIIHLVLRAKALCPLEGSQLSFTVSSRFILPAQQKTAEELNDVLSHVNQKFPQKLKRGLRAGFRELRMEALGEW